MRIAILMFYDQGYDQIGNLTKKVNAEYASRWGYTFIVEHEPSLPQPEWSLLWEKITLCIKHIQSGRFDWVLFVDADAMIVNHEQSLELLLGAPEKEDSSRFMVCAREGLRPHSINSGVLLFCCGNTAVNFLRDCLDYCEQQKPRLKTNRYHEQDCINDLVDQRGLEVSGHVEVLTHQAFNCSYLPAVKFVYHVFSVHREEKAVYLFHAYNQWRRGLRPIQPPTLQNVRWHVRSNDCVCGYLVFCDRRQDQFLSVKNGRLDSSKHKSPVWILSDVIRSGHEDIFYLLFESQGVVCALHNGEFGWTPNISITGRLQFESIDDGESHMLTVSEFPSVCRRFAIRSEKFGSYIGGSKPQQKTWFTFQCVRK